MTRYDDVQMHPASGLTKHPLAGVPQEVLDAATKALTEATEEQIIGADDQRERVFDSTQVEVVAHAVLLCALEAQRAIPSQVRAETLLLSSGEPYVRVTLPSGQVMTYLRDDSESENVLAFALAQAQGR